MAEEGEKTVAPAAEHEAGQAEQVETSQDQVAGDESTQADAEEETEKDEGSGKESDKGEKGEKDDDGDEDKPRRASRQDRYRRNLERLQRENAELRSRVDGSQDKDAIASLVRQRIGDPPKEEDFKGDFLAYDRALSAYETRKAVAEDRVREKIEESRAAHQHAQAEIDTDHLERVQEFRSQVKDWDETMASMRGVKISPVVESLVKESSKSGHLVYHLAKNPDRLERLNGMSEREAAREIGRIEARLSQPSAKTRTSAPPPVSPLKGGSAGSFDASRSSMDDYIAKRKAGWGG